MIYKGNISEYKSNLGCISGRLGSYEDYCAEYAKELGGHGLEIGPGPHGLNANLFSKADRLDGCDVEEEVLSSLPSMYEEKFNYKLGSS